MKPSEILCYIFVVSMFLFFMGLFIAALVHIYREKNRDILDNIVASGCILGIIGLLTLGLYAIGL